MSLKGKLESLTPEQKQKLLAKLKSQKNNLVKVSNENRTPLTQNQHRLLFLEQLNGPSDQYHIPYVINIKGALERDLLAKSVKALSERHRILKCKISDVFEEPFQIVDETLVIELQNIASNKSSQSSINEFISKPFNFETDALIRFGLCQHNNNEFTFVIVVHHIIFDAGSTKLLFDELITHYQSLLYCTPIATQAVGFDFLDYANYVAKRDTKLDKEFWLNKLKGISAYHSLPLDYDLQSNHAGVAQDHTEFISGDLISTIKSFSINNKITNSTLLSSLFMAFLARWGQSNDIVIGMPYSHRERIEFQQTLGFFVNNLVVRAELDKYSNLNSLLPYINQQHKDNIKQAHTPFDNVVEFINPERVSNHSPIFQICFNYQIGQASEMSFAGLTFGGQTPPESLAKFDVILTVIESGDSLALEWKYNSNLFTHETIQHAASLFNRFVLQAIKQPDSEFEQIELQENINLSDLSYSMEKYNHTDLFSEFKKQVDDSPFALAYVDDQHTLNFIELYEQSVHIANILRSDYGIQSGDKVAVNLPASLSFVKSVLAIISLKATYVPLDPKAPPKRNLFITQNCAAKLAIDEAMFEQLLTVRQEKSTFDAKDALDVDREDLSPAYICYTSGTTGEPKGVLVEHASVISLVHSDVVPLSSQDNVLMCSSAAFDAMTFELWAPLLTGATICRYPEKYVEPDLLHDFILQRNVNVAFITTALFRVYSNWLEDSNQQCQLTHLLTGGEKASAVDFLTYYEHAPHCQAYNIYGPTESTTFSVNFCVPRNLDATQSVPIGIPLNDTIAIILNSNGQIQPAGMVGELCIAGRGNSLGYLNNTELTNSRFIYKEINGQTVRLYRTGDMVYKKPNGDIVYLHRNDGQVKIRGFRIELGEIASVILNHTSVKDAFVAINHDSGEPQIVCYYVSERAMQDELIEFSGSFLPSYMVPIHWVLQDVIPTNINGKIDKSKLPAPVLDTATSVKTLSTETQKKLAQLWGEFLPNSVIDIESNFFNLGGHSLMALKLLAKIRITFEIDFSLADIFAFPRLDSMSNKISRATKRQSHIDTQAVEGKAYPLSAAQARLWLVTQLQKSQAEFHMPTIMRLKGVKSLKKLEKAITLLRERHTALRTQFVANSGEVEQLILPNTPFQLTQENIENLSVAEVEAKFKLLCNTPFNLLTGDVFHATWLSDGLDSGYFVIVIHHIVCDGVSVEILGQELIDAYNQPELLNKRQTVQYVDFACWQREWLTTQRLQNSIDWWHDKLNDLPLVHSLPLDYARSQEVDTSGHSVSTVISSDVQQSLISLAKKADTTVFNIVQSAFCILLNKFTGDKDIVFGSPIANRDEPGLETAVGLFLNNVTIRHEITDDLRVEELIKIVGDNMVSVFEHQHVPFEQVVEKVSPVRNLGIHPLFQIMLNHQKRGEGENFSADDGMELKIIGQDAGAAKYELTSYIVETPDALKITFNYQTSLFKEERISRLLSEFVDILESISDSLNLSVGEFKQQSVSKPAMLSGYQSEMPSQPLMSCIEQQCLTNFPDSVMLTEQQSKLSGRELWRSVQSAAYDLLYHHHIKEGAVVALIGEKSADYIIHLLALNLIGAVSVPLGNDIPQARLDTIIENAGIELVIGDMPNISLPISNVPRLNLEHVGFSKIKAHVFGADQPMYLIFTSGTTGKPKGVKGTEKGLLNRIGWMKKEFPQGAENSAIHLTEMGYIRAMWELYLPLVSGSSIHLCAGNYFKDLEKFSSELQHYSIKQIVTAPSILKSVLLDSNSSVISQFSQLKYWFVSGEKFPDSIDKKIFELLPEVTVVNLYGSSEVTSDVSFKVIGKNCENGSVGQPIFNTKLMIFDENNQMLPELAVGEVVVSGAGLALGYHNNSKATQHSFIFDNSSDKPIYYKTGDIGYISLNQELILLGRRDEQISIRGYRVEIGEIEAAINKLEFVQHCEILPVLHEQDGYRIVVFATSQESWAHDETSAEYSQNLASAREFLAKQLPHYMLPSQFVLVNEIPLKPNGKVDKYKLSKMLDNASLKQGKVKATSEIELKLADIWQVLLNKDEVFLDDMFFDIGGNSLLANQLINCIEKELNVSIPLKQIFTHPTLRWLSKSIEHLLFIEGLNQSELEFEEYEEFEL